MEKVDDKWIVRVILPPGTYQYKYIVNGKQWIHDISKSTIDDNYCGLNNSITIPQT
jgi:hypothetical protein